nr:7270_t:CDS:2 [Entrophospora candida]
MEEKNAENITLILKEIQELKSTTLSILPKLQSDINQLTENFENLVVDENNNDLIMISNNNDDYIEEEPIKNYPDESLTSGDESESRDSKKSNQIAANIPRSLSNRLRTPIRDAIGSATTENMSKQQQKQKSSQAITANNKRDNQREKLKDNWEVSTAVTTFDEMKLKPEILNGIRELNIAKPTPLQQRGITALLTRKDCVIQVPRCEERALTYLTAILEQIEPEEKICQAVVIIHLKDLCYVIQDFLSILGKELQLSCFTCVGGFPLRKDIERLMNSPQIIIATPGRLIDLISQRRIDFSGVKTVVVEDSCIMFNSTFRSQTFDIIFRLARRYDTDDRQRVQRVLMTTATTFTLADIKNRILQEPHIVIDDSSHIKDGSGENDDMDDNRQLSSSPLPSSSKTTMSSSSASTSIIIFCDNSDRVNWLFNKLGNFHDKFNIFALHLSTEQLERHEIIKSFWNKKSTKSSITITLDCFASVLAFYPVKYCIQFDLPFKKENYQDRICCCGGYGVKGINVNIINKQQMYDLDTLERYYKVQSNKLPSNAEPFGII